MSDNQAKNNINNSKPVTNEETKEWEVVGDDLEEATPIADQEAKLRTNSRVPPTNHLGTSTAAGVQQDAPPPATTDRHKHFVVGEYDIAVPTNKVPLLGVMASSGVFFIAVMVKNLLDSRQNYGRYGIALSVVSFVVAFVSLIMPLKCTFVINLSNYFLFAWNFVGACIFTFNGGPFESTGNGYFAVWSSVVFSAIAADPPGTFTSRPLLSKMNSILDFGAGAIVVLISLALALHEDSDSYMGEIVYTMLTTCISICAVFMFSLSYMRRGTRGCMESQILMVLSIMWIIGACAVTFSGPFLVTGNGYFASWVTAILSVKAASYSWEHRNDDELVPSA